MQWTDLETFRVEKGEIAALWLVAREVIAGYGHLRLKATGRWVVPGGPAAGCDPDGVVGLNLAPDSILVPGSPAGCLVGRLGGSTASYRGTAPTKEGEAETKTTPGAVFAIGRYCVLKLPDGEIGPLLIGFNLVTRPITLQEPIELTISGANFT